MDRVIVFVSSCPSCKRPQPQEGFSAAALVGLLEVGQPIEAYCVMCALHWPISPRERAVLANALLSVGD